jgi:hypothetical protein
MQVVATPIVVYIAFYKFCYLRLVRKQFICYIYSRGYDFVKITENKE